MKAIKVQGGVGGVAEEVGVVGGVAEEVGVGVGVMVMDWFDKGEYMHALIVYVSCYDYGVSQLVTYFICLYIGPYFCMWDVGCGM